MAAAHADQAGHHHRRYPAIGDERHRPADAVQQGAADRGERELPEGAAGRRDAERHAALFRRHRAPHRAQHHREAGGADTDPDQQALAQMQPERIVGPCHPEQTGDVDHGPQQDDPYRTVTVGERAEEGLGDPPDDALNRDGEREGLARYAEIEAYRRAEEAEA